jgi:DNA-binding NarL/FixJ family response regulator
MMQMGAAPIYGITLVAAYLVLVLPDAVRASTAPEAVEQGALLVAFSGVTEAWVRAHRAWLRTRSWIPDLGAEALAIRNGLARALPRIDIPIDAVLSAGRMGLTALQAELLAYLLLGLTNQEIADATQVSEATVRYRLTPLYRTLGVTGRKHAADRARELGLTVVPPLPTLGRTA